MTEEIKELLVEFQNKVKHKWCKLIFYSDGSGHLEDIQEDKYFEFENEKDLIIKLKQWQKY
jgi:hypothetical protein